MNGKGDKDRTINRVAYRERFARIDWQSKKCINSPTGQHRPCFNETLRLCLHCGKLLNEQDT